MTMATTLTSRDRTDSDRQPAGRRLRQRIKAEFVEMPGLKITLVQAARLFGADLRQSATLLQDLVDEGFLRRDARGAYLRRGLLSSRSPVS